MNSLEDDTLVLATTQHWLTRAVIGLNLCPFAKNVYIKKQIRYVISRAATHNDVLAQLEAELQYLNDIDPLAVDTTLLILPDALDEFFDFNSFMTRANQALKRMRLVGEIQIAGFHPHFQFADSQSDDDIENYTNRAPYPILHLLREASVERAVVAFPDATAIYQHNQETLRKLGHEGWEKWLNQPGDDLLP